MAFNAHKLVNSDYTDQCMLTPYSLIRIIAVGLEKKIASFINCFICVKGKSNVGEECI